MASSSHDIQPQTSISPQAALAYAREHGVENWFHEHVLHKRTLQDRIQARAPLKERELDRFDRLALLIERATDTFQNADKALSWLQTPSAACAEQRLWNTAPASAVFWKCCPSLTG